MFYLPRRYTYRIARGLTATRRRRLAVTYYHGWFAPYLPASCAGYDRVIYYARIRRRAGDILLLVRYCRAHLRIYMRYVCVLVVCFGTTPRLPPPTLPRVPFHYRHRHRLPFTLALCQHSIPCHHTGAFNICPCAFMRLCTRVQFLPGLPACCHAQRYLHFVQPLILPYPFYVRIVKHFLFAVTTRCRTRRARTPLPFHRCGSCGLLLFVLPPRRTPVHCRCGSCHDLGLPT